MMKYCMVITTCKDKKEAVSISKKLLENKLASCVQLNEIESFYCWKNKIYNENEIRMMIKTQEVLYKKLEKFLLNIHSYDIPQIIMLPIEKGVKQYFDWVDENLK